MRGSCPPGLPLRGSGAPWSFLCQMEKERTVDRLSSRLRCWVHSRPGLQSLLPEVLGAPGEVPTGQSAHFTQSRLTEPAPLELCAHPPLPAYIEGRCTPSPSPLYACNLMDPRSLRADLSYSSPWPFSSYMILGELFNLSEMQ